VRVEKTALVAAPRERVWKMLLDPHVMAACVPGMESIEVLSDTDYTATLQVKLSFVSARIRLKICIAQMRAPAYLCSIGTGEDSTVTSTLKQTSEIFLDEHGPNGTQLRMDINVELLGRLGTFGLNAMKTKADRMWEEFARNLAARVEAADVS